MHEAPLATRSGNSRKGWRPLALVAALALATACSNGRGDGGSASAQRDISPDVSGAPAPAEPEMTHVLIDCNKHPDGWHSVVSVGDPADPNSIGELLILGTYDETAAVSPGGKPTVKAGVRVENKGDHRFLIEPINYDSSTSNIRLIRSTDPSAIATYEFGGASFTVETVPAPMRGSMHNLAIMATVACNGAARP